MFNCISTNSITKDFQDLCTRLYINNFYLEICDIAGKFCKIECTLTYSGGYNQHEYQLLQITSLAQKDDIHIYVLLRWATWFSAGMYNYILIVVSLTSIEESHWTRCSSQILDKKGRFLIQKVAIFGKNFKWISWWRLKLIPWDTFWWSHESIQWIHRGT